MICGVVWYGWGACVSPKKTSPDTAHPTTIPPPHHTAPPGPVQSALPRTHLGDALEGVAGHLGVVVLDQVHGLLLRPEELHDAVVAVVVGARARGGMV